MSSTARPARRRSSSRAPSARRSRCGSRRSRARGALPRRALRPARARALARRRRPDDDRRPRAETSSSSSTSSASSGSRFAASRSAGSKACGSPSTPRSGSSASRSAARSRRSRAAAGLDRSRRGSARGRRRGDRERRARPLVPAVLPRHPAGGRRRFRAMLVATPREGYAACCDALADVDLTPGSERSALRRSSSLARDDPVVTPAEGDALAAAIPVRCTRSSTALRTSRTSSNRTPSRRRSCAT